MKWCGRLSVILVMMCAGALGQEDEPKNFEGGLSPSAGGGGVAKPVRNAAAQPADPIVTKRYFKIEKGTYPEFVAASRDGVWPYFEKIGARVIGMWKVIHPDVEGATAESPEYDEVILMTRYASVAHWQATRETVAHGGNGPDWDACLEALRYRRSVTLETHLQFLQGLTWTGEPWFLPGLDESYERVE